MTEGKQLCVVAGRFIQDTSGHPICECLSEQDARRLVLAWNSLDELIRVVELSKNALWSLNGEIQQSRTDRLLTTQEVALQDSWHATLGALIDQSDAILAKVKKEQADG